MAPGRKLTMTFCSVDETNVIKEAAMASPWWMWSEYMLSVAAETGPEWFAAGWVRRLNILDVL
jgi:hypothetical protein